MQERGHSVPWYVLFLFLFFFLIQVDDQQLHLNAEDIENLDAAKLSRFIHMNNLHWVTEYSPMVNTGPCGQSYALVSDPCPQNRDALSTAGTRLSLNT